VRRPGRLRGISGNSALAACVRFAAAAVGEGEGRRFSAGEDQDGSRRSGHRSLAAASLVARR